MVYNRDYILLSVKQPWLSAIDSDIHNAAVLTLFAHTGQQREPTGAHIQTLDIIDFDIRTSALNPELTIMGGAGPWGYTFGLKLTKSNTIPDRIKITPNN